MIGVIELKGYHIVAAEEDGIYTIVIPEYPNILVTAADPAEIVKSSPNLCVNCLQV